MSERKRQWWGSRFGVILAVTGSAVGLGNFLRYPGLAAQYEGGAFMIPYFIAFMLLGLPIAWVEWTMGRYGGRMGYNSPPGIFRVIWKNRAAPYVGALSAVVPVLIYMYYIHLEGWCLGYAVQYLTGAMRHSLSVQSSGQFLEKFTGMDADGHLFSNPLMTTTVFVFFSFLLNFVLIYRGINKGIEWFNKLAMPALIICALLIVVRVLTLPPNPANPQQNVINGLGFMWNPATADKSLWEHLSNMQMWVDATGQIFFTLSVGFGLILTYASYVRPDDDIALSATTAAAGNEFCEVVLGGLMIIPTAFIFLGAEAVTKVGGSALSLGFVALPSVFEKMPLGQFFGFLFFVLLFLAAVTSSLSMLQPAIAMLEEGLGLGRKASVALLGFITAVGAGFVGYFSQNVSALDTIDFWIGSFMLYVLATILVITFGWVMGVKKGQEELDRGAGIRIPRVAMFIIKYISPVYLLVLFGAWIVQAILTPPGIGKPSRIQQVIHFYQYDQGWKIPLALGFVVLVGALFLMLAAASQRRWDKNEANSPEERK